MPIEKDFKRLVRRRMQKTGESYTAARAQLLKSRPAARKSRASASKPRQAPVDYAGLAGMSDAAIKANTGCTWERWVRHLDRVEAHTWPHRKIAEHVREKFDVPDWWTQAVTVGYERIRGLREIGQQRGGGYEATKSKTFAVAVSELYGAFTESRRRARWLPGIKLTMRKSTPGKYVRIAWEDGTAVEVGLIPKGPAKCSVQIQHRKLPDKASAARMKTYWAERLDALQAMLSD